jgi:hypothetical protein
MSMRLVTVAILALAGCATSNQPTHPLTGTWRGEKTLELAATEYRYGAEQGHWTADAHSLRYAVQSAQQPPKQEQCDFSLVGRALTLRNCRLAGRYQRAG